MPIEFTSLASSSAGCAYIVRSPGLKPLLIECGIRYAQIQIGLDFDLDIAGCLISHAHGDHCKSARDMMCRGAVNCYASTETAEFLRTKHHELERNPRLRSINMAEDQFLGIEGWTVTPFEAEHDMPGTLGFVVDSISGDRLLYLTDTAYSRFTFAGLTHMAIEANFSEGLIRENAERGEIDRSRYHRTYRTHMSVERLLEMLKANDLSEVEEIHLLHLSSANSDAEGFKRQVQSLTGIPTYIAGTKAMATI